MTETETITERGILALIDDGGAVVAAASFRRGDPDDLNRAVEFVNDGRRSGDKVRRYLNGEVVRIAEQAPECLRGDREGDCDLCDGWHPLGDHGSSNVAVQS